MKSIFFIFFFVSVTVGLVFYHVQSQTSKSKAAESSIQNTQTNVKNVSVITPVSKTASATVRNSLRTSKKSGCSCCNKSLKNVKFARKALEVWAREMINTHGYEEGMKRVTAKSPVLAKRVQQLLEKEKSITTNTSL